MIKILKKALKIIFIIVLSVFILFTIIQLAPVQNFIAKKALSTLDKKFDIPLEVEKIQLLFFNTLKLKDVKLTTSNQDTIFYVDELKTSIRLRSLLKNKVYINQFKLNGAYFNLVKNPDSTLNLTPVIESFSSNDSVSKKDSAPWDIYLNRLILDDINVQFNDKVNEGTLSLLLGKLNVKIQSLDINNKNINLQSIDIDDVIFATTSAKPSNDTSVSGPIDFNININKGIKTKNIELKSKNQYLKQDIQIKYDKLNIFPNKIDLTNYSIDINTIDLKGALINYQQGILTKNDSLILSQLSTKNDSSGFLWNIKTENLNIDKSNIVYVDQNKINAAKPFTEGKITINNINSEIEDIWISPNNNSVNITSFNFVLNDEFPIKKLIAEIKIDSSSAAINNVVAETKYSKIQLNGKFNFNDSLLNLNLSTKAGNEDLSYFLPDNPAIKKFPDIQSEFNIDGKLSNLLINSFTVKAGNAVSIDMDGKLENLLDSAEIYGDVNIKNIKVLKQEVEKFIPDSLLPEGIVLPDTLELSGHVSGSTKKLNSNIDILSNLGSINAIIDFENDLTTNTENFIASLNIKEFNAEKLLNKPDTLGLISFQGIFEGRSFDFKNPELSFDANISQVELLKYNYHNINLKGNYKENFFKGQSIINDENVALVFDGKINLGDSIPEFTIDVNIDSINLDNINVVPENMQITGHLIADITGKEWNKLKGNLNLTDAKYLSNNGKYSLKYLDVNFNQYTDSARYVLDLVNLTSNDTMLLNKADIDATLFGKNGNLIYAVYLSDTTNQWVKGKGEFLFTEDTILVETKAKIKHFKSPSPLDFALDFKKIQENENQQNLELTIDGTNSHLTAYADLINNDETTDLDANIEIDSLNLGLAEPFLTNQFSTFNGVIDGRIKINGSTKKPDISGDINIKKTELNPIVINTPVYINNQSLAFKNNRLTFKEFVLTDNQKNKADINGYVDVSNTDDIRFDLTLLTNEFKLLNKPASAGGSFYGNVTADVNAEIKGNATNPVITLNVGFNYASDFYYVAPESNTGAEEQEGVIVFVNNNAKPENDTLITKTKEKQASAQTSIDISTNLEISDKLKATIITDPYSDESLEIKGNGNLSFNITGGGSPRLVGTYNITSGKYKLKLYEVLRREFDIISGSNLSWSGDILDATADISASYSVNVSSSSLQDAFSTTSTDATETSYAQIPVDVVLNLTGNLLTPDIDFDIELDESYNQSSVQAFILNLNENESELNKQVFSLLLFNSFLSEGVGNKNPLAYELTNTAQKSLSSLLSASLNRFTSQYISGANISFDIKSYNKQQDVLSPVTDFGLDFQKNLFNNRLSVQVGGNLVVDEEEMNTQADIGNSLAGEFLLEYKLTKNGALLLQGYNKTEYEDIVDGELKKTGIAVIFNKEFDTFMELFNRKNKNDKDEK